MGDSRTALDMDRLPWLADEEEAPRRTGGRFGLIASGLVLVLLLSGISYWLGTKSGAGPDLFTRFTQAPPAPPPVRQAVAAEPLPTQVAPITPVATAGELPSGTVVPATLTSPAPPAAPPVISEPLPARSAVAPAAPASTRARPAANCGGTAGSDDRACGNVESAYLGALDQQLAALYSQSWNRADAAKQGLLLRTHDRFVARLGNCRSDSCRKSAYLGRMSEISEIAAGQWANKRAPVSTAGLAALNQHLSSFYKQSWGRADEAQRAMLLRTQDRFVDRLDACRSDPCKSSAYLGRMREVSDIMGTRERPPANTQALSIRAK